MHLVWLRNSLVRPERSVGMVALLKMPMRIGAPEAQGAQAAQGAERRIFPRKEVHAAVESLRADHSIEARRTPKFHLHLRDLSYGGMSANNPPPPPPRGR